MFDVKMTGKIGAGLLLLAGLANAEFSLCKFNFGVDWSQHVAKNCSSYRPNCSDLSALQIPAGVDFIASFVGWTQNGSTKVSPAPKSDKEGRMITDAKALSATPVWYTYIIAEGAKTAKNLTDCNVGGGSGTLCTEGANYIRGNKSTILAQYTAYAQFAAANWGTKPMIWALEPDFVQYTEGSQNGGGLSSADAKQLLSDIADAITAKMPNAWISMDISPWKDQSAWLNSAVPLTKFKFMNTSGGVSQPSASIKNGEATWSTVWGITKKGMIADDGYGTNGQPTNPNSGWSDVSNLNARINDGVIALMEAVPGSSWGNTISGLRSQLSQLKTCSDATPGKTNYTLSVDAGTNGAVTLAPDQSSYDSGSTVQLLAKPKSGYVFKNWSGDASGSMNPLSFKILKNSAVTAVFAKTQYMLTITTVGMGTVNTDPVGTSTGSAGVFLFDSATSVRMTATPSTGVKFLAWSGDVSGAANLRVIPMLQNHSVTATFTGATAIGSRMVQGVRIGLAQGKLLFDASGMGRTRLELVDVHGRHLSLWQGTAKEIGQVSLEGLPSGIYFVALQGQTETVRQTIQLVR